MSDEIRRPRRIIPDAAAPQEPLSAPVTSVQLDRFRRALSGVTLRRREAPPAKTSDTRTRSSGPSTPPVSGAANATTVAIDAPTPTAAAAGAGRLAMSLPPPPPLELPALSPVLPDPAPLQDDGAAAPEWERDLARRVGLLCRRADPAFQSWQVTVPLDPAVLPETDLHLSLSPHRLALRFQTQSSYSLRLVSEHTGRLVALLEQALPYARDIDVEVT